MSKLKFLSLKKKAERQFRVEKVSNQGRKRHFSARTKFKKKQLPLLDNNMRPSTSMDPKKKFFITTEEKSETVWLNQLLFVPLQRIKSVG